RFDEFYQNYFVPGHSQRITAITSSRDGGLWIPMDRGPVAHLNRGTVEIITNDLPNLLVDDAIEDGEGALWISYRGGVIRRVKDGEVSHFSSRDGLPSNWGGCFLARDKAGVPWFAKGGEVFVFRNGRFEIKLELANTATRLTGSADGGIWICSALSLFK